MVSSVDARPDEAVGSQFRSRRFVEELKHHDLTGSIGRVGAAGHNAAMESFFALLQKNGLNQRRWRTREEVHPIEFATINAAADAA